jgi:hypothetical protein
MSVRDELISDMLCLFLMGCGKVSFLLILPFPLKMLGSFWVSSPKPLTEIIPLKFMNKPITRLSILATLSEEMPYEPERIFGWSYTASWTSIQRPSLRPWEEV